MNHPEFTRLRRLIDEAITFNDTPSAENFAREGLRLAEHKECLGERMYFLAQMEIVREDFGRAMAYLDKAICYNPQDGAAYNDKALCQVELGKLEGVLEVFEKGIEVEPDYATIYHNKGWFLNRQGRCEEALVCFEKALEIEPGRGVTYENMANAYERMGLIKEALGAYRQALGLIKPSYTGIRKQICEQIKRLEC